MDYRILPATLGPRGSCSPSHDASCANSAPAESSEAATLPPATTQKDLARIATSGTLAGNAQKAWDILNPDR